MGHEFELQRSATANPEREGPEGGQKRDHAEDGMTAAPETLHLLGFWSFEQGQPTMHVRIAHTAPTIADPLVVRIAK